MSIPAIRVFPFIQRVIVASVWPVVGLKCEISWEGMSMKQCKWSGCKNEARAKSPFCGDTCYKRWKRAGSDKLPVVKSDEIGSDKSVGQADSGSSRTESGENVPEVGQKTDKNPVSSEIPRENGISDAVTPTPDSASESRIASIEDYYANRGDYAERACPELLNWGPWMSASQLATARLSGNRVTLPGDWDYVAPPVVAKESCYL